MESKELPHSLVRSERYWRKIWPRKWITRTVLDPPTIDLTKPIARKFRNDFWCKRCGAPVWPILRMHEKFAKGDLNAHMLSIWQCTKCGLQQFDPERRYISPIFKAIKPKKLI
jgi:hypothetical protein